MDKQILQIGNGGDYLEKHRGRLTGAQVLQRYKNEDLPAFCGIDLTDVNQVGLFGERPLDVAAVRGDLEEIYALLDAGADIDAQGEHGYTALHEATAQGHSDAVRILLQFGARTDIRNEFGDTLLDIASSRNRKDLVEWLKSRE
jgi:ankyrin repeat protein